MNDYGILTVRTTTASGAYPVKDVSIHVSGTSETNEKTKISLLTDESGNTQPILLPAPPIALSLSPNAANEPYSKYDVEVFKEGYYRKKLFDVAVFPGITSILPVNMIPSTPYNTEQNIPKGEDNVIISENLTSN